jgi:hypothetical protein
MPQGIGRLGTIPGEIQIVCWEYGCERHTESLSHWIEGASSSVDQAEPPAQRFDKARLHPIDALRYE